MPRAPDRMRFSLCLFRKVEDIAGYSNDVFDKVLFFTDYRKVDRTIKISALRKAIT